MPYNYLGGFDPDGDRYNTPLNIKNLDDPSVPYSPWRIPVSVFYIGVALVVGFFVFGSFF